MRGESSPVRPRSEPGEFLSLLNDAEFADLRRGGRPRRWERGATVFTEGDVSDWALVLTSGRVKVSSHTANGTEVVLAVRGPGALLGDMSAIDGEPRSATVTADGELVCQGITLWDFQPLVQRNPTMAWTLLQTLAGMLRQAGEAPSPTPSPTPSPM